MRSKLQRFEDNRKNEKIIEPGKEIYNTVKGNWNKLFENVNPISLEIGCGKGIYTTIMADKFPDKNFIGIDIKGSRLWHGAQQIQILDKKNILFLRAQIENIEIFFSAAEVAEIIITFPDPRPKKRDCKRRLTSNKFLKIYDKISNHCTFHLKTDNTELFHFTIEELKKRNIVPDITSYDLHNSDINSFHKENMTEYEKKFTSMGLKIKYLKWHN